MKRHVHGVVVVLDAKVYGSRIPLKFNGGNITARRYVDEVVKLSAMLKETA